MRANIKTASEGLTLLTELKTLQDKGAVSTEEAEKLKRVLLKSVDDLFLKGVYTTDMQESMSGPTERARIPEDKAHYPLQ